MLYDDKLDGVISVDFYKKKNSKLLEEKQKILNQIDSLSKTNNEYYRSSVNVYELSQSAKSLFAKDTKEGKRETIKQMFSSLVLDEGRLHYTYSKPFELLKLAVGTTNSSKIPESDFMKLKIFEPVKKPENSCFESDLHRYRYLVRE